MRNRLHLLYFHFSIPCRVHEKVLHPGFVVMLLNLQSIRRKPLANENEVLDSWFNLLHLPHSVMEAVCQTLFYADLFFFQKPVHSFLYIYFLVMGLERS